MNTYEVWNDDCIREMLLAAQSAPQLMQGPAAKKKWTAESRGSGKYQGWSKTGIDTYNSLVDAIAKQRLNTRNKTILSNFEPNLRQMTFADQQAAEPGCRGNTGTRKRKAANSLSLGLESPTGFVLQGLPTTASTMMGV